MQQQPSYLSHYRRANVFGPATWHLFTFKFWACNGHSFNPPSPPPSPCNVPPNAFSKYVQSNFHLYSAFSAREYASPWFGVALSEKKLCAPYAHALINFYMHVYLTQWNAIHCNIVVIEHQRRFFCRQKLFTPIGRANKMHLTEIIVCKKNEICLRGMETRHCAAVDLAIMVYLCEIPLIDQFDRIHVKWMTIHQWHQLTLLVHVGADTGYRFTLRFQLFLYFDVCTLRFFCIK